MAKITEEVEISYEELMELVRTRYPQVKEKDFSRKPFLNIRETGDHDRGNYDRKLVSLTFYLKKEGEV